MYTEGHKVTNAKRLPLNLLDALRAFEGSEILMNGLGHDFSRAYLKLRQDDWNKYTRHLTDWERETTLDC
jgi:glutamine synthetase